MGHALMENRHGLLVDFQLTHATGTAERDVVPQLLYDAKLRGFHPRTGSDATWQAIWWPARTTWCEWRGYWHSRRRPDASTPRFGERLQSDLLLISPAEPFTTQRRSVLSRRRCSSAC